MFLLSENLGLLHDLFLVVIFVIMQVCHCII